MNGQPGRRLLPIHDARCQRLARGVAMPVSAVATAR